MSQVFVYALIDPRDEIVRYVGQTADLETRRSAHVTVRPWMAEVIALGREPMVILETCDEENALQTERRWIAHHAGPYLENSGRPAPGEHRDALRELIKDKGEEAAARAVGVSRSSLLRAAGGFGVRSGTLALLREWYAARAEVSP